MEATEDGSENGSPNTRKLRHSMASMKDAQFEAGARGGVAAGQGGSGDGRILTLLQQYRSIPKSVRTSPGSSPALIRSEY